MEDMGTEVEDSSESIQEFQVILDELVGDESMDKVRAEYEKLIQVLIKSRENEKRLMSKCRELNAKIVSTTTKVADALKMRQEDETKMNFLKRELDKAWKMVDVTHEDTKKDKETIRTLKEEIAGLNKKLEQQPGVMTDQDQIDQVKLNDKLMEERDQLQIVVDELREKLDEAFVTQEEVETQRDAALDDISQVQQEIQLLQNEISREIRLKDKLDKELRQLQLDMEARMGEIKGLNVQAVKAREEQQKLEHQIRELKAVNERYCKDLEQMQAKNSKLQQESEQLSSAKEHLTLENLRSANQLKMREEDLSQMKHEAAKQTRLKETNQRKLRLMEEQKADMETQKEMLKAHISALEKDLETSQKLVENEKKSIEELIRERDILSKNMIKSAKAAEKQQSLVKVLEQEKKTLEHEINAYRQKAQQERKIIQQLEKERDRYINENGNLIQKVQQKMSDNEVREGEIYECKKKVTEAESKIKQQEHVLESVVGERNLYSKNLIEAQEEMVEIKRNMGIMSNQVSRLRDEITGKELALAKDQQEHKRLEKNNDVLKAELLSMKNHLEETKQQIESQKVEQHKLQKIIADTDAEVFQLKKQLEQVVRERDNLGKHLLRRNNECSLLYEKIRIQQSVLTKGDFHYNERMKDINLLKLELRRLRRKKSILDSTSSDTEDLRRKLFYLQKELLKERTRNTTLEEQLKPVNIHRWRLLEGNDPGKFELIVKIQSLQKRLIVKTQGLEERELLLQEKETLYVELKHIMAKQPGPEVAEQLYHCQKSLQEQTKKLRAMTARLEVFDSKINDYKNENQTLTNELTSFKKKYFSQKKLYSALLCSTSEQQAKSREKEPEALPQRSSKAHVRDGLTRIDTLSI